MIEWDIYAETGDFPGMSHDLTNRHDGFMQLHLETNKGGSNGIPFRQEQRNSSHVCLAWLKQPTKKKDGNQQNQYSAGPTTSNQFILRRDGGSLVLSAKLMAMVSFFHV